jgi:glyoxylase-like metal-dependent hydrolase (beta-lactamase superfamily II)
MFPQAKSLDYYGWWIGDTNQTCDGNITDNIKLIKTPGHSYDGLTMLVNTADGKIAICGDVFWKQNFPVDDPYASDKVELAKSRKKLLEIADWVVPGHGEMYKTK